MKPKISVIVPVYNVEAYLGACVESIFNQTLKDIEIILVDDGATDNSGKLCDEYQKKDERIKVIHKQNGGLSSARNAGLEIAKGKYVTFLDSDDLYLPKSCELLYNEIEKHRADYVIGNYQNCDEDGTPWKNPVFNTEKYKNFKLSITDYHDSFYVMNSSACNKIFRKSFIDKLNLRFVDGAIAEDTIFTTYCFIKSTKVYYFNDVIYLYRQRNLPTSISNNCSYEYFNKINKAYRMIYENFRDNNQIGFYRFFYAKSVTYMMYKFIDSKLLSHEEKIKVLGEMRWFYKLSIGLKVPMCQEFLTDIVKLIADKKYEEAIEKCEYVALIRKDLTKEVKEGMSKPPLELYEKMLLTKEVEYE